MLEKLDDENFLFFAASKYYNPRCSEVEDFYEDLNRIKYIKRLINRYIETDRLSERLLLNHIIVFCDSFTIPGAIKMFEFKVDSQSWQVLKPFLIYLKYIEESAFPEIESDLKAVELLRKI